MQLHQEKKIIRLLKRLTEVEEVLSSAEVAQDIKVYKNLTQEHAYLTEVKLSYESHQKATRQLKDNRELLKVEKDPDFIEILKQDTQSLEVHIQQLIGKLENLLIPPNPQDHANTIIEIRAGTGGDEAALFVGDCVRMYKLFADRMGWKYERLSATESELGGFKEYVMVLSGTNVYRMMQHEAGTHRVQRVPETEAQGRVHTSAITIAVLLEPDEDEELKLDERELRFDTYRSSGAGGQHVNTTDSAVRVTHIPTGVVTYCQEEKSQHKNKEKALRLLKAKLVEMERQKKKNAIDSTRALQVGSGDRSERIRTYNFPQNRLTDHRINLTKYNLDQIMNGALEEISSMLVAYYYQQKLEDESEL